MNMNYIDNGNNILKNFLYNENRSTEATRIFRKIFENLDGVKS